jgi:hypothetical protein
MRLGQLTYLILEFNAIIDQGAHTGISMREVKDHIEKRDLFSWLRETFEGKVDLSLYDDGVCQEINEMLDNILNAYGGNERRKWGVQNSGICLLLAWTNELVQQRQWEDAKT